jgi:hypothetical protein
VTVFGDSVATSLYSEPSHTILGQGINLDLQAAPCRRIEDTGCNLGEGVPTSVLQDVDTLNGNLGETVVMTIGYNEFSADWVQSVEDALSRFQQVGVKRVYWLTLREMQHQYIAQNAQLEQIASEHPELTILDWNVLSRSHPEWFQDDGIHLLLGGTIAMATMIHSALVDAGIAQPPPAAQLVASTKPPAVTTQNLPPAVRDRAYHVFLAASGGKPPYRWRRASPLPHGLVLASDGLLAGVVTAKPGRFLLTVALSDALGRHATGKVALAVESARRHA